MKPSHLYEGNFFAVKTCFVMFCCDLADFMHIFSGYIFGTGTVIWPQYQWSNPEE